jgi:biopolymer transport protein ExbD
MRVPKARNGPVCDFDRTVTPMVDVVFQLLVFFVLASGGRMAEQSLSTVLSAGNVPAAETAAASKRSADHWIHLARNAAKRRTVLELNGRKYGDFSELRGALRELAGAAGESRVILDVAGNVPLGDVILVYDSCRAAKFHSINFAASPEELGATHESKADKSLPLSSFRVTCRPGARVCRPRPP